MHSFLHRAITLSKALLEGKKGSALKADFMDKPLEVGSKIMLPPLMPSCQPWHSIAVLSKTENRLLYTNGTMPSIL